MFHSQEAAARRDDYGLASGIGRKLRDSDWGGYPRTREEDLAWAARRAAVTMAAAALQARDGETGAHCDDVVHLPMPLRMSLVSTGTTALNCWPRHSCTTSERSGFRRRLLDKPGPLDDLEWALIRKHTLTGEQIIRFVPELEEISLLVRHSHERWDGGGYPDGLAGERIPLASRIVFCADASQSG